MELTEIGLKKILTEALAEQDQRTDEKLTTLAGQFTQIIDNRFIEERSYIDNRFIEERGITQQMVNDRFIEERAPTRQMMQAELIDIKTRLDRLEAKISQVFASEDEDVRDISRRLKALKAQFRALEAQVAKLQPA